MYFSLSQLADCRGKITIWINMQLIVQPYYCVLVQPSTRAIQSERRQLNVALPPLPVLYSAVVHAPLVSWLSIHQCVSK